jgi:transcriptional regulator of arginine metabolism
MQQMNRAKRLLEISNLINEYKISNQEELMEMLDKKGYSYTQATLSRDLRTLKAGKIADEVKGYIYILPGNNNGNDLADAINRGFLSLDYSGNMAVIKTMPGFASGIALRIDGMNAFEIIGTIAGDDTIIVIARDGVGRQDLHRVLTTAIPGAVRNHDS